MREIHNNQFKIQGVAMTPEVYDWEAALHKVVTSKEGDLVGNVDATDDTSVLVSTEGGRTHYKIQAHVRGLRWSFCFT